MKTKIQAVELLLSDARGIYIPQHFCTEFDVSDWQISEEDVAVCLAGPDHESYWDAWQSILNDAKHIETGHSLHQDGDLFALNYDEMSNEERHNFDIDMADDGCINWFDYPLMKRTYEIHLSPISGPLYVHADCERDALDIAVDDVEQRGHVGYFVSDKDWELMTGEERDAHTTAGNHCLMLAETPQIFETDREAKKRGCQKP